MSKFQFILPVAACVLLAIGCSSKEEAEKAAAEAPKPSDLVDKDKIVHGPEIKSVELTNPLNQEWVTKGQGHV